MATKLKKFSYSIPAKIIAFLLAALCVFISVNELVSFYSYSYNQKNEGVIGDSVEDVFLQDGKDFKIYESKQFENQFYNVLENVSAIANTYKDGSDAAFEEYYQTVINGVDSTVSDKINSIINDCGDSNIQSVHDLYGYDITEIADEIKEDDYDYDANNVLALYTTDGNLVYYRIDYSKVKAKVLKEDNNFDKDFLKEKFDYKYNEITKYLETIKNLKVAVVDKDGNIYSNISGFTSKEEIEKSFEKYDWNCTFSDEAGFKASDLIENEENLHPSRSFYSYNYEYENNRFPNFLTSLVNENSGQKIYIAFDISLAENDVFSTMKANYESAKNEVKTFVAVEIALVLLVMALSIFLILKSGRKEKDGEVKLLVTDKYLNVLHFILSATAICILILPISTLVENAWIRTVSLIAVCIYAVFIEWVLSFSRNIKNKTALKNNSIYWLYKKVREKITKEKEKLPTEIKINKYIRIFIAVYAVIMFILTVLAVASGAHGFFAFLIVVFHLCLIAFAIKSVKSLEKIMLAAESAKSGDFSYSIDLTKVPFWLRGFANSILEMRDGTKIAIENALKDEKMKTQLITNVSHDLKTPLTSIINYVDLLSKCNLDNEDAEKYIGVLTDKSERLKKLIEDLVEAAKASSGSIAVHPVRVNLNEIALQISGELSDELEEKGIEVITKTETNPVYVKADSRLTFRILENLFVNVKKYALPNTRAYVTVKENGTISVSNISLYPIDVSASELKNRFVRGDASRNSEGSGLGLSIADDFAKLQNGNLEIKADSDLFKVTLTLPKDTEETT